MTEPSGEGLYYAKVAFAWIAAVVVVVLIGFAFISGIGAFSRWQGRANRSQDRQQALLDARNKVKVSHIEIQNQTQRVTVAKQRAEIRHEKAVGIREAQDEIAKTLTPLYVQFEMTQALLAIARSGENSSVVYIPSGANGVPLVATANPDQVTAP